MIDMLLVRCAGKTEGWISPCAKAKGGHRTTVAKQFRGGTTGGRLAGLTRTLLCPTRIWHGLRGNGNLAMVMKVMGRTDVRTAMRYQHPILDPVREAIDQRNSRPQ